jgi:hypothetical protein
VGRAVDHIALAGLGRRREGTVLDDDEAVLNSLQLAMEAGG